MSKETKRLEQQKAEGRLNFKNEMKELSDKMTSLIFRTGNEEVMANF